VLTTQANNPDDQVIEATLTADRDETILVWEERGMPLDLLAAYGAGVQGSRRRSRRLPGRA
jgi:hypothetical protein